MKQTIDAVFENGVFRPLKPPSIPSGRQVVLEIEMPSNDDPEEILALAGSVFDGLTEKDVQEIEKVILDRDDFFGNRKG